MGSLRLLGLLALGACAGPVAPKLISASPDHAQAGTTVTVSGVNLCGASGGCDDAGGALQIGLDEPVLAALTAYSSDSLAFAIPTIAPVGPTALVLTVDDSASNALEFTIDPPSDGSDRSDAP